MTQKIFVGIPVLNRFDLLDAAIASLDYPELELFIVNNNTVDATAQVQFEQLRQKYNFDSFSPRFNLGVAASWNRIITTAWSHGYEFVYIGSNDTTLGSGTLRAVVEMEKPEPECLWLLHGFNFWCFRLAAIPRVGLVDENFMPAYFEDNDFHRRVTLAGLETVHLHATAFEHNGRLVPAVSANHLGSQTIAADAEYAAHNGNTFNNWNAAHYTLKWGGGPGGEQFVTPYNYADKDLRWWPDPAGTIAARDWDNCRREKLRPPAVIQHLKDLQTKPLNITAENYSNTDKHTTHSYVENVYTALFTPIKYTTTALLEIGIGGGDSLRMWRDFFPNAEIHGVDVTPECAITEETRIRTWIMNAYSADAAALLPEQFDVIIDDGPHSLDSMLAVFEYYAQKVKPGGLIVVEDVQSPDWLPILQTQLPAEIAENVAVYDLRTIKNRYDDLVLVWKKPSYKSGSR
jgi:hypothetical protein